MRPPLALLVSFLRCSNPASPLLAPVELEGDLSALLKSADTSNADGEQEEEDQTVELEGDMSELLGLVASGESPSKNLRSSPKATSMLIGGASPKAGAQSPLDRLLATCKEIAPAAAPSPHPSPAGPARLTISAPEILTFAERNQNKPFAALVHSIPSVLLDSANKAQVVTPIVDSSLAGTKVAMSSANVTGVITDVLSMACEEVRGGKRTAQRARLEASKCEPVSESQRRRGVLPCLFSDARPRC